MAGATDEAALSDAAAKLISETFDVLAVTVWLFDPVDGTIGDGRFHLANGAWMRRATDLASPPAEGWAKRLRGLLIWRK